MKEARETERKTDKSVTHRKHLRMLDACNGRAPYVLPFILCGTCSYPFQPLRHGRAEQKRGSGKLKSAREGSLQFARERVERMRATTRGGSPVRSVVAGGAGGQRLSRGWTRRVFCRTSFALSTPICPLLSSPRRRFTPRLVWPRTYDPAPPPRALSRSAAPPSTSITTPIVV